MRGSSAVNTTHYLIIDLIKEGKLKVEKLNSQVHFLTASKNYDLPQVERESLIQAITEVHSYYENIAGENKGLVAFLIQVINNDRLRSMINDELRIIVDVGAEFGISLKLKYKSPKKAKSTPEQKIAEPHEKSSERDQRKIG
jgi:hypothetical protein